VRRFPESAYHLPFFDEHGYVRRSCPVCGEHFWTLDPDRRVCGESTPQGCAPYTFIGDPPTRRRYSLREMREAFLSFFEGHGHERIRPYPVVARWRDDLYFTHASIIDFQPYVTEGIIPPPANPLVISQPCIRFLDVDNVGPTFGRHLTIFEMGGHHAFNHPGREVYWKDQTVRYHHEFVTGALGIKPEEVVYKEGVWSGGGNGGPDVETVVRGLEVATLVFMQFKVVGDRWIEQPIRTVDTGYGIERYTWLSQGSVSCFHAVYGPVLDEILGMAGVDEPDRELLRRVAELSGVMGRSDSSERATDRGKTIKRVADRVGISAEELEKALFPLENAFAAADHTKCLAFMLAEGVVPSNVREGYLTRLMARRTHRALRNLGIEGRLLDIIDRQITLWSGDFPHLREMRDEIVEILSVEQEKFRQTLRRGRDLVKRTAQELKAGGASRIPPETLIELYDSHGVPPEIVQETAEGEGVQVEVPENFYTTVAEKHVQPSPPPGAEATRGLEEAVSGLPETRRLYYEDPRLSEFEARVLRVTDGGHVVLDETAFYPEGGGQPGDRGYLQFGGARSGVVHVQRVGNVIVHTVEGPAPREAERVRGFIDQEQRGSLMRHHTATHLLMGAARRVLGEHVWQTGAQKGVEQSRLDISHFRRLTLEEVHKIEGLANQVVTRNVPVEVSWMARGEAEGRYGFRLYQGGVVPGREIRVVKIGDWDVEACGGTHCGATGEVGFIKTVHTERIQDGVERIVFTAGLAALKPMQENDELLWRLSEALNAPRERLVEATERLVGDLKEARRKERELIKEIAIRDSVKLKEQVEVMKKKEIGQLKFVTQKFEPLDIDRMIRTAGELVKAEPGTVAVFYGTADKNARIVVMAGGDAVSTGVDAREIAGGAAALLGGGGSGRTDFAQGGGTRVEKMPEALQRAEEIVKRQSGGRG